MTLNRAMNSKYPVLVVCLFWTFDSKNCGSLAFTSPTPTIRSPFIVPSRSSPRTAPLFETVESITGGENLNFATLSSTSSVATNTATDVASGQAISSLALPKPQSVSPLNALAALVFGRDGNGEYQQGLVTIGFITLLFASNSPVLHAAFHQPGNHEVLTMMNPPPLMLNAAVSVVALVGLLLGGETLEQNTDLPSTLLKQQRGNDDAEERITFQGGCELGLWKFLATTANIYGLSLTTAAHGAFLIQLTTLIVPSVQGLMGVPIPRRIQYSIVLALAGVLCFTQDPTGTPSMAGDLLCVAAAAFYATYDLRLFSYGKLVPPRRLITGKIATQALLSVGLLGTAGSHWFRDDGGGASALQETLQYVSSSTPENWAVLIPVVLWSGVVVNAVAPFLQVGGQQVVGPTRCQTIYASQPLWAAIMSFVVFGETIGWQGLFGGTAFLTALFLAATAEAPNPDCGKEQCEV